MTIETITEHKIIFIQSYLASVQDILPAVEQYKEIWGHVSYLIVYAAKCLIFDADLTLPEITVLVFADRVRIILDKILNLSGKNGTPHQPRKAQSAEGQDAEGRGQQGQSGLPGEPGGHSGHCFMYANAYDNIEHLSVKLVGGNGGEG